MTINVPHEDTRLTPALRAGIRKRFSQVGAIFLLQAAMLFLAAGRLDWVWAWSHRPESAAPLPMPSSCCGTAPKRWPAPAPWKKDGQWVGGAWAVTYFVMLLVVAGLDQRWWTSVADCLP